MSETLEAPPPTKPRLTPAQMVEKYIALRDKLASIKKRQTEELAPYNAAMSTLEAWLMDVLNTNGVESMRAESGTFFTTTRISAKVDDWDTVLSFIIEGKVWELLEARVNKTAVKQIMDDSNGAAIPGVVVSSERVLNVRRA